MQCKKHVLTKRLFYLLSHFFSVFLIFSIASLQVYHGLGLPAGFKLFFLFVGYFKENILAAVLGVAAADTTKIAHLANKTLEVVTLDIFTNNGWPSNNRLGL